MKKSFMFILGFGSIIGSFSCLVGYAYHVHHMHNPVQHQHIFLLSDIHLNHRASTGQREAILTAAKLMDAVLLTEDQLILYSPLEDKDMVSCDGCLQPLLDSIFKDPVHFEQNKDYGVDGAQLDMEHFKGITPIFLLTHCARSCGIKALSVECRQIEMVSTIGWPIAGSVVYKTLQNLIGQIAAYDDGFVLNNYYAACLKHFNYYATKYSDFFKYLEHSTLNLEQIGQQGPCFNVVKEAAIELVAESFVQQYREKGVLQDEAVRRACAAATRSVENSSESVYDQFFCDLLLFLVDTRILHSITMNKHESAIMVFAGGAHIDKVKEVLELCGYVCLDDVGASMRQPRALNLANYFKHASIDSLIGPINLFDFSMCCSNSVIDFTSKGCDPACCPIGYASDIMRILF